MKSQQVVAVDKGVIELREVEVEEPAGSQVLFEVEYSAISPGTELAFLHALPNTPGRYPFYPGYSAVGRIARLGPDVPAELGLTEGQRVATSAKHAERSLVNADRCIPISSKAPLEQMATFRLLSICLQGVRKGQVQLGESTAVLGLGPIGHLAGQIARAAGSTCVVGFDPVGWRRALADEAGFEGTAPSYMDVPAVSSGAHPVEEGFDLVIEASGVPAVINQAFALAAVQGRTVLLGSTRGETERVNFYRDVHKKGLLVIGAHDGQRARSQDISPLWTGRSDELTSVVLLESGRVNAKFLVSDVMSGRDAARAYARLNARDEQLMTIVLDWTKA